jgi:hypothetical protein
MARHFKAHHTGLPTGSQESALSEAFFTLPEDTYYGFALGAESDHSHVIVEAGITVIVPPGSVVPIPEFTGQPRLRLVDTMIQSVDGDPVVHLIGLTNLCELAVRPRRAVRQWPLFSASGGTAMDLALGRRRHALIYFYQAAAVGNLEITGLSFDRIGQVWASALLATVPLAASVGVSYHVGGTDHEEGWNMLRLSATGAGLSNAKVIAWGELGG